MKVHVFKGPKGVFGYTEDETGTNLPSEHGPWQAEKSFDATRDDRAGAGDATAMALADIQAKGFHLAKPPGQ